MEIEETPNFKQIEENQKNPKINLFEFKREVFHKKDQIIDNYLIPNKKIQVNIFKTKLKYNN